MNILYYDLKTTPAEEVLRTVKAVIKETGEKTIALPKENELLLDCDLNLLYSAREILDEAIDKKLESLKNEEICDKIIKENETRRK